VNQRRRLVGVVLAAAVASIHAQQPTTVRISGDVAGASGHHTIHVALWSEPAFLEKPVQEIRIEPGRDAHYLFVALRGRWAISAYEDRNENGVLDLGVFGPKEPNGFWRPFRGRRKPLFADVASTVDADISDANVLLR
jgi:uncharacterized protein (DUF2141 family)